MAKQGRRLQVICPCCQAKLVIEPSSGLVLRSNAKKSDYSFEKALRREEKRKKKSDQLFAKAFQDEKERQDALEAKFRQALESQDELEEPIRPLDLD
ncbi:MAG: hypothetical protein ACE5JX_03490 [Acidobacteriota bacterium]